MPLIDADIFARLHRLALRAGLTGRGLLAPPRATLPSGGTEPTGLRDYAPGDDYRAVDWPLAARRGVLMTRLFAGDEDRRVELLLDRGPTMKLGNPSKLSVAVRLAALVAAAAIAERAQVRIVACGPAGAEMPWLRQRGQFGRLAGWLGNLTVASEATDLAAGVDRLASRHGKRGLVLIVSDCTARGSVGLALGRLRHGGFEPRLVHLYRAAEANPPAWGDIDLCDGPSHVFQSATLTPRVLARYRQLHAEYLASIRRDCAAHAARCVQLPVELPEEKLLRAALAGQSPADCAPLLPGATR